MCTAHVGGGHSELAQPPLSQLILGSLSKGAGPSVMPVVTGFVFAFVSTSTKSIKTTRKRQRPQMAQTVAVYRPLVHLSRSCGTQPALKAGRAAAVASLLSLFLLQNCCSRQAPAGSPPLLLKGG